MTFALPAIIVAAIATVAGLLFTRRERASRR
jgi:hypothetical protein